MTSVVMGLFILLMFPFLHHVCGTSSKVPTAKSMIRYDEQHRKQVFYQMDRCQPKFLT